MRMRTVIAFLVAPASFGILLFALSLLSSPSIGVWAFSFSAMIAYPPAIVIGVPLYLLLNRAGRKGLATYSVVALFFSVLLVAYFIGWPHLSEARQTSDLFLPATLGQALLISFACFLTVFVFWFIARPDKQAQTGK